ncbi:Serine/threonine-protein phosphatase 2A 65 kDa regulatory subunit A alpha isoform [Camellia lanceoleosa]|uniref:Serine/threonine-protein phosphatase 2A 65 kDa regulatory subunit A alpha isoform n=1 Tax=Camellia lanceoleosa TaxID=1840588 RepID=A0ACC0IEX7_9ERIC|nr:Serine/threonine-protein phosphatase 2A 65 kDa regulatory subunit A alpha isoform [Camellia lanceoleosa]
MESLPSITFTGSSSRLREKIKPRKKTQSRFIFNGSGFVLLNLNQFVLLNLNQFVLSQTPPTVCEIVYSIRDAAANNLKRLAEEFGPEWAMQRHCS